MQFNELQLKLWFRMIESIELYLKGGNVFSELIYELEGYLIMADFLDKNILVQWYNYWTPLEILHLTKGNSVSIEESQIYLNNMYIFLKKEVELNG